MPPPIGRGRGVPVGDTLAGMRFGGTPSWQVRWGDGYAVAVALYLRDALALSAAPEIPPLVPSVPVTDAVDRPGVAAAWPGWWAEVLAFTAGDADDPRARHAMLPLLPASPPLA